MQTLIALKWKKEASITRNLRFVVFADETSSVEQKFSVVFPRFPVWSTEGRCYEQTEDFLKTRWETNNSVFFFRTVGQLSRLTCGSPQHVKINTTPLNEALAVVCVSFSSLDTITPEERDIEVKQADLKKHLTLTEVEGKPWWVCLWK